MTTDVYSLDEAAKLPLAYNDKRRVREVARRLPESLHGLFSLHIAENNGTFELEKLQVEADPILAEMNTLREAGGVSPLIVPHGSESLVRRMSFTPEQIDAMLEQPPGAIDKYYDDPQARTLPARGGLAYTGTFSLPEAVQLKALTRQDRILLERLGDAVPKGMNGAFFCDLKRENGAISVARVSLIPTYTLRELESLLLSPAARAAENHPTTTYRHPQTALSIDPDHLKAALDTIKPTSRRIG